MIAVCSDKLERIWVLKRKGMDECFFSVCEIIYIFIQCFYNILFFSLCVY